MQNGIIPVQLLRQSDYNRKPCENVAWFTPESVEKS